MVEEVGVADWEALRETHPGNTDVLEELAKAYLWQGDLIAAQGGDAYLVFDSNTYRRARRALWAQAAPFQLLYMLPASNTSPSNLNQC